VKLDVSTGVSVQDIEQDYDMVLVRDVLSSRGIFLLEGMPASAKGKSSAKARADAMAKDTRLEWAEPNVGIDASDDRFHAWPEGAPTFVGFDRAAWLTQPVVDQLNLNAVHDRARGDGVTVAVLDTGIDEGHRAFDGAVSPLWDYVDDDRDPTDHGNGLDDDNDGLIDEALGHGTHVAGIVHLVAPEAKILDARVLNADGQGNIFVVAEAIADAVAAGADVLNLSFGTVDNAESKLLADAVAQAQHQGVIVVASAGNEGTQARHMPADLKDVLAVGGLAPDNSIAAFSNRGQTIRLAAPAVSIISPVPGGGYASWSGTSMAAPIVAGEVALLRGLAWRVKPNTIRSLVLTATTRVNSNKDAKAAKSVAAAVNIMTAVDRLVK
jgi:subtilisin family serine protease